GGLHVRPVGVPAWCGAQSSGGVRMSVRVKWNINGFYDLRRAPGVVADLERRGRAIQDAAGGESEGYLMSSRQGAKNPQGRWRVGIAAALYPARRENTKHNTLLKALDAGR